MAPDRANRACDDPAIKARNTQYPPSSDPQRSEGRERFEWDEKLQHVFNSLQAGRAVDAGQMWLPKAWNVWCDWRSVQHVRNLIIGEPL